MVVVPTMLKNQNLKNGKCNSEEAREKQMKYRCMDQVGSWYETGCFSYLTIVHPRSTCIALLWTNVSTSNVVSTLPPEGIHQGIYQICKDDICQWLQVMYTLHKVYLACIASMLRLPASLLVRLVDTKFTVPLGVPGDAGGPCICFRGLSSITWRVGCGDRPRKPHVSLTTSTGN